MELKDTELQKRLLALGFPKLPVTETTRGILLNKLHKSAKRKEKMENIYSEPLKRQDMLTWRQAPEEGLNNRFLVDDVEVPSKNCCERMPIIRPNKIYQLSNISLPGATPIGKRMDKSYKSSADYAIRNSPDNNNSLALCTEQQSDLGVVNRLLSFRDKTFRKSNNCMNQFHSVSSVSKHPNKYITKSKRTIYEFIAYVSAQSRLNQSFKPYLLVGTFVCFFICLSFIYVWQNPNNIKIGDITRQISVCDSSISINDCVPADYVDNTINLLENMIKLLHHSSKPFYCSNKNYMVSETEFIQHLKKIGYNKITNWGRNLMYAKLLIEQNPQWKITIIPGDDVNYVLSIATKPLFCTFYNKIQSFFIIIGIGAVIALCSVLTYAIYRYVRTWRVNRSHIIEQFTTDIVNELIYRASLSETPKEREIIMTHMRDKLIPLSKRKTYLKYWNEALHVLEANDSRIQFGVRIIDGEECRTLKWMGNGNTGTRTNSFFKKWQSPAFDFANKIVNPPTSCLKIRHMFDTTEANISNLKQIIEASLIEKVGTHCGIRDIQIDKQTCCVYVRCNNEVDAGIIHNEINGWWFDKRLISIKFLRLQRYLARFPNKESTHY